MWRIKKLIYFILGKFLFLIHYEKKYCKGSHFSGINADGWRLTVKSYITCRRTRSNIDSPYPVSIFNTVTGYKNIFFHEDDMDIFQGSGKYFQGIGTIAIGKGTYIANNVGIITANHKLMNLDQHEAPRNVMLGNNCWIGMNSVILPGVILGDRTIVGAGSIVVKSFPEGHCVIAGNPAKLVKYL